MSRKEVLEGLRMARFVNILRATARILEGRTECELKPFAAVQRVQRPPDRGAARQLEPSLGRVAATSLVKPRQRMLKPCVSERNGHYPLFATVRWGFNECVLRAVMPTSRSQGNDRFRPESGRS